MPNRVRLVIFLLGFTLILICAYTILLQTPWANIVNVLFTVAGLTISYSQLLFDFPIRIAPSRGQASSSSTLNTPSFHSSTVSSSTATATKDINAWAIDRSRLIVMLTGTIFCAGLMLFIQTLADIYFHNPIAYNSGIFLSILYLLVCLILGATFGPWVGLVVTCGSLIFGGFAYYYFNFGEGITSSLHFATILWPFYLASATEGFIVGLTLFLTKGHYKSIRSLVTAECLCLLALVAQTMVINSLIGNPPPLTLHTFFNFTISTVLIIFPFLLLAYNALILKR